MTCACMNLSVWLCVLCDCVYGCVRWVWGESSVRAVLWFTLGFAVIKLVAWGGGENLRVRVSHACERLWCGSKAEFRFSADAQKWSVPPDSCVGSSCHAFVSEVSATWNSFLNEKPAQMLQEMFSISTK